MAGLPYPIAHPAAVLPLVRPMGRLAVASALALGSTVPDLWYFVPFATRAQSHSLDGLLWMCLPLGLAAYLAFHLLLKEPLVALAPRALATRLAAHACAGLPHAPWHAVLASLLAGAATHLAWDAAAHSYSSHGHQWLQHASTLLGTTIVVAWSVRELRRTAPCASAPALPPAWRAAALSAFACAFALCAAWAAHAAPPPPEGALLAARHFLRSAGLAGTAGLGIALLAYCALWQLTLRAAPAFPATRPRGSRARVPRRPGRSAGL